MPTKFDYGLADIGGRFQAGVQQSQQNRRQNALLDLEQKQYGLNERRVNAEEARLKQADAQRAAELQRQQQFESRGVRALAAARGDKQSGVSLLQELGLPPELADDPDAPDMFSALAEKFGGFSVPTPQEQWMEETVMGPYGPIVGQRSTKTRKFDAIQSPTRPPVGGAGPKAPTGYRYTADGTLEAIPGGPAATKFNMEMGKQAKANDLFQSTLDAELANIDKLIGSEDGKVPRHKGLESAVGVIESRLPTVRQKTADAEALADSLSSKASISSLQTIRGSSAGAIGQITEREWPRLENMKATLQRTQGTEQYTQSLKDYREELKRMKREAQFQFDSMAQQGPQVPQIVPGTVLRFDENGNQLP